MASPLKKLCRLAEAKKAVFLDLDNTLYDYAPCHQQALRKTYAVYQKAVEKVSYKKFLARYESARKIIHQKLHGQAASHSRLLYFQTLLESLYGKTDSKKALLLEKTYWGSFVRKMRRAAWVLPFLKFCRQKNKKIGIVTNLTSKLQLEKIVKLGLQNQIDFLVTSEEAGIEKPSPKIYQLALKKAGCKRREVLTVGDEPLKDKMPGAAFYFIHS